MGADALMKSEGIISDIGNPPLETMNVCIGINVNLTNSLRYFGQKQSRGVCT